MKHIHRFFISTQLKAGETARLSDDDSFHALKVLRLAAGDGIEIADASGHVFGARVVSGEGPVEALAEQELEVKRPARLTVAQALPKGRKMDLIVEKLSELGVECLAPLHTEKSMAGKQAPSGEKLERWRRVARAAAGQAHRSGVMEVQDPKTLDQWLSGAGGRIIALATETDAMPLGSLVREDEEATALVVGPEAGFSTAEIAGLTKAGADFASLGQLILRTETAAIVAATVVMHRLGAIG
jgi:16S rRNA (uracil1498-N3)-methyltransferase